MQNGAILFDLEAASSEEAIRALCGALCAKGLIKDSFAEAAIKREQAFPTGLPTEIIKIAIPHTDAIHVISSSWAAARLAHPVPWQSMEDPDETLDVEFVILLATDDPKAQLPFLRKITRVFQDSSILCSLRDAKSENDILRALDFLSE